MTNRHTNASIDQLADAGERLGVGARDDCAKPLQEGGCAYHAAAADPDQMNVDAGKV